MLRLLFADRLKLGEWQSVLNEGHFDDQNVSQILNALKKATELAPTWYKAWHAFAQMNFELGTLTHTHTHHSFKRTFFSGAHQTRLTNQFIS
jgi:FKBP12-rapamycin complex-associated protein